MTTAAILNREGTVHRLVPIAGLERPDCNAPGLKVVKVRPVQALVFHLPPCLMCFDPHTRAFEHWVNGDPS